MKKIVFSSLLGLLCYGQLPAQSPAYTAAMEKGLQHLSAADTPEDWQTVANTFARIAQAEAGEWLPVYYVSLSHMNLAMIRMQAGEMDNCQVQLDKAQEALDQARARAGEQSEIAALQGLIYTGRIWPDVQALGAQYSPLAHQMFEKARALDPGNPRAYMLQGQLVLFTPPFWGGGAGAALPLLREAREKFAGFAPTSPLHPAWGAGQAEYLWKMAMDQTTGKAPEKE